MAAKSAWRWEGGGEEGSVRRGGLKKEKEERTCRTVNATPVKRNQRVNNVSTQTKTVCNYDVDLNTNSKTQRNQQQILHSLTKSAPTVKIPSEVHRETG